MNNKEHNNLPKQEENLNNECDMPNQKYLIVNKLFKTYIGGYTGINDISFDLQKGEQLIILSDISGGKTTLWSVIAGLESATSGDTYLDGKLINDYNIKHRNIGYIDSSLQLQTNKKVIDIISYPLKIRKFDNNKIIDKVVELANKLEISDILQKKVNKLSYYEKCLVAIARLATVNRGLYLIDDIFINLSNIELNKIIVKIKELFKDKTLIIAVKKYKLAKQFDIDKILLLGYSTNIGFGSIQNKEMFFNSLAGVKLYLDRQVCCIPCSISGNKIIIANKEYQTTKSLKSNVFDSGIICIDINKIAFNNSKQCSIKSEIGYINQDNIAYLDIENRIATIYLSEKKYKVGDYIEFSFDISDTYIYDNNSEMLISI